MIMSGTEFGRTLGTPIAILVRNNDQRPKDYGSVATQPRPSHADYTCEWIECQPASPPVYPCVPLPLPNRHPPPAPRHPHPHPYPHPHAHPHPLPDQAKYGIHASSGGGRSSARETVRPCLCLCLCPCPCLGVHAVASSV